MVNISFRFHLFKLAFNSSKHGWLIPFHKSLEENISWVKIVLQNFEELIFYSANNDGHQYKYLPFY